MGNLIADTNGNAFMSYSDKMISLYGEFSIIGRSVVVHAQEDDLGKASNP
jgi:Cu-Zn family superoxide dismutase